MTHHLQLKILDAICKCKNLKSFQQIHTQLVTSCLISDDIVTTKAVEFFGKSVEYVNYACHFFIHHHLRSSSYTINTLIAAYANCNKPQAAVLSYNRLRQFGFCPDLFLFPVILKSCTKFSGIREGKQIHALIIGMGFGCDLYIRNSLLHLYGSCGECDDATKVFDDMLVRDVVSWSSLISGFVKARLFDEVIVYFTKMNMKPNVAAFVSVVVACGSLGYANVGKGIHGLILKHAFENELVLSNALLHMYVKCECLGDARQLFSELPGRDVVTWTTMISGLAQYKSSNEALDMFEAMLILGLEPDKVILTSILSACASIGALNFGRWVHDYIDRKGIIWDTHIGTAMVDMYLKCGCIDMALGTFNKMSSKNLLTWNALLGGLAMNGYGRGVLEHFQLMVRSGMKPNEVTFLSILTACCHSGMADEGLWYFYRMEKFSLSPGLEHYGCIIDLLCKAGLLDEAQNIVRSMPMPPDVLIWGSLLSACNANGYVELSQDLVDKFHLFEAKDSGIHVLLSNRYAIHKKWDEVRWARRSMKEKRIEKSPGLSAIEVNGTFQNLNDNVCESRHGHGRWDLQILLGVVHGYSYNLSCISPSFLLHKVCVQKPSYKRPKPVSVFKIGEEPKGSCDNSYPMIPVLNLGHHEVVVT